MATAHDAEVILKFYDLRREAVLRKARHFVAFEFAPQSFDEFRALGQASGDEKNAWWRQVLSYWEMGASLVLSGAVDADLFCDSQAEGLFLYAKFSRFHAEYLKQAGSPFMPKTAALVEKFPAARAVYDRIVAMISAREAKAKD
jgi:hypothetical protein